jgi:hypothetical protein
MNYIGGQQDKLDRTASFGMRVPVASQPGVSLADLHFLNDFDPPDL